MSERPVNKQPCKDCPWKRTSIPGWLGADTPEDFVQKTEAGAAMPCHKTVDYEQDEWEEAAASAPLCAGALIYLVNSGKLPFVYDMMPEWLKRDIPVVLEAMKLIEADTESVFQWKGEFLAHHKSLLSKLMEER